MFDFPKRILFVGYGAVGHCTLPILLKHINVPMSNITVLDFDDRSESLQPLIAQGLRWVQVRITPENLVTELARYVAAGDLIIDLAWNIDCCEILQWCHDRGVLYINTSVEVWDPYENRESMHPDRAHALLAAHEHPPDDRQLGGARPHGGARARRESRA